MKGWEKMKGWEDWVLDFDDFVGWVTGGWTGGVCWVNSMYYMMVDDQGVLGDK